MVDISQGVYMLEYHAKSDQQSMRAIPTKLLPIFDTLSPAQVN